MNTEAQRAEQELRELVAAHERRIDILEARLAELEARLETVGESFVRHQGQNESDLDLLTRTVDRVGQQVDGVADRIDRNLRAIERRQDEHRWSEHSR